MLGTIAKTFALLASPDLVVHLVRSGSHSLSAIRSLADLRLRAPDIGTFIDVGANEGQFALSAAHFYPQCRIHSFEPIPEVAKRLTRRLRGNERAHVHRVAVGSSTGSLSFHCHANSQISSALPILRNNVHPDYSVRGGAVIEVPVVTLDDFFSTTELEPPVLLKLDVQGYEVQVLRGSTQTLRKVDYMILEAPFMQLYEDQPMFDELHETARDMGFRLACPLAFHRSPTTGISEVDFLYYRPSERGE